LFLKKFETRDLIYISVFAAMGLAIKPIVTPLIHLISAPLLIPGGSLAGGFYMMWISLAIAAVGRFGTGFLTGFIQALVVLALGFFGSHGGISLLTYSLPGLFADIFMLPYKQKGSVFAQVTGCTAANLSGTVFVSFLVMRLPVIPLMISLITALISGITGGLIAYKTYNELNKYHLL